MLCVYWDETNLAKSAEKVMHVKGRLLDQGVIHGGHRLSSRVLDSRRIGSGFEPHQQHCVMVFEQDTFILA